MHLRIDEQGLSTVEYIVILVLISLLGIISWNLFGDAIVEQVTGATAEVDTLGQGSGKGGKNGAAAGGAGGAGVGSSGSSSDSPTSNSVNGATKQEKKPTNSGSSGMEKGPEASGKNGVTAGGSGVDKSGKSKKAVVAFSADGQVAQEEAGFSLTWIMGGACLVLAIFLGIRMGKSRKTGGA